MSAAADRHPVGVAGHEAHAFDWHAEPFGDQLRKARLVPLPLRGDADHHLDGAFGQNRDLGFFPRHAARGVDVVGDAHAAALAAFFRLGAAARETRPVGELKRARHDGGIVAAVVFHAERIFVRHLRRGHQIAPAKLDAIEAELARGDVDQPLDDENDFRPSGTAVGAGGRAVAEHGARARKCAAGTR